MDRRIQQALDHELPREQLSAEEAKELAEAEALIASVVRSVPIRPLPDLSAAVMRRVQDSERATHAVAVTDTVTARGWRAALSWLWAPRPLVWQWRPAYAFALVIVLALGAGAREMLQPSARVAQSGPVQQVLVQFRLDAPQAQQVSLAGNFTNWQPAFRMTRSEPGVWTVVVPLDPGVHDYGFIVDGERWVADPMAPAIADGFGGVNSRVAVLSPDRASSL
jgi:hypothetical protein